jgi:hypothetical protein
MTSRRRSPARRSKWPALVAAGERWDAREGALALIGARLPGWCFLFYAEQRKSVSDRWPT